MRSLLKVLYMRLSIDLEAECYCQLIAIGRIQRNAGVYGSRIDTRTQIKLGLNQNSGNLPL